MDVDSSDSEDELIENKEPGSESIGRNTRRYRPVNQRGPYLEALKAWVDDKFNSAECSAWDIDKSWILSEKQVQAIARHPGISSVSDLGSIKPPWVHTGRWGTDIVRLLEKVANEVQERKREDNEQRMRIAEEKQQQEQLARQQELEALHWEREEHEDLLEQQHPEIEARQQVESPHTSGSVRVDMDQPKPKKRQRLSKNATEEEKLEHQRQIKERKNAQSRARYHRKKLESKQVKQEEINHTDAIQASEAGPSHIQVATAWDSGVSQSGSGLTLEAKQELVDRDDLLYTQPTGTTPLTGLRIQQYDGLLPSPATPSFASTGSPSYTWITESGNSNQPITPCSMSRSSRNTPASVAGTGEPSPSTLPMRRQPIPKYLTNANVPNQPSNPSPSL